MADRDQHPSREDEIRHAVFGQVDLQTAELEIVSSIYDGFAVAIVVKGQPRTIALTREYGDAVQLMALIERGRSPQAAASEAGAAAGDPKGRRSIYDAAYDSIRKGAPGLSDATCAAISRSINLKVANGSASAEPGAIDEDWIRGLISEAVVMAEDQEREDESDEEICRIAESVLTAIRPYLRAQPQAREDAQPVAIVPPHCTGASLAFEPGVLHVSKDGSGYIAIDEEHFSLEDDRCQGPDGPEGSVHWITRLDASEVVALRDFLTGATHPAPDALREYERLFKALRDHSWDLRCFNIPTGGDDYDIGWRVVGHWQAEPRERTLTEVLSDDPAEAVRQALAALQAEQGAK